MIPLIAVAPMIDRTDRHARYFFRLIAPTIHLYSEMITTHALMHGDVPHLLSFHPLERHVALQLGGNEPSHLAHCAKLGEDYGYDEININVGCPSSRVQAARFGACLMLEPELVAACVTKMRATVAIPITVKCRIGVDHNDSYAFLSRFIKIVAEGGCQHFIIHARKAWLNGLSPKQNREIPPLDYACVNQIKKDFPHLTIILNGGIQSVAEVAQVISNVDGVMIGRAAYQQPFLLAELAQHFFNLPSPTRLEIMQKYLPYVRDQLKNQVRLIHMTRPILGLFQGQPGAAAWRRYLSEHAYKKEAGVQVIEQALTFVC